MKHKRCGLCGLELVEENGKYHKDCGTAFKKLADRMRRRRGHGDYRHPDYLALESVAEEVQDLLVNRSVHELKEAFGDKTPVVEELLISVHLKMKELGWRGLYA